MSNNLGNDNLQNAFTKLYEFVSPISANADLTELAREIETGAVDVRKALLLAGVTSEIANAEMTLSEGPEQAARVFFAPALNALNMIKQEEVVVN